ncbi:hypothetical protein [Kitasatospora phosalacinea]|uniref:Phosphatidic acid phosphatase type 2/haloperoxidase domain-containing protein n=1 Tax=Kitasatospora phosalacinea TaxID=2065 RepID=A0ABW6GG54_9ACTN
MAGTVMILVLVLGAAAIGWSRTVLKAHPFTQILVGTALGGVAALVFGLLR